MYDEHEQVRVALETSRQYCERLKRLDAEYGTTPDSPLHHDRRCNIDHEREARV